MLAEHLRTYIKFYNALFLLLSTSFNRFRQNKIGEDEAIALADAVRMNQSLKAPK